MPSLRVAQWHQNGFARGQEAARAELLAGRGVQLLMAQELNAWRFLALRAALGPDWWGVHSLTCTEVCRLRPATGAWRCSAGGTWPLSTRTGRAR